jgi:hypothetical protein
MEEWYQLVRNLKDESEDPYMTQMFVYQVYRDLNRKKIKEKVKFRDRMGPEFDAFTAKLSQEYPEPLVVEIISDDDFWRKTLELTIGV